MNKQNGESEGVGKYMIELKSKSKSTRGMVGKEREGKGRTRQDGLAAN